MYKFALSLFLLIFLTNVHSHAAEKLTMDPETGLVNDKTRDKLNTVKDLFQSKKNSVPKAPDIISNKPELVDIDLEEPQENTESKSEESKAHEDKADKQINYKAQEVFLQNNTGKSIMFEANKINSMMRVFSAFLESNVGKEQVGEDDDAQKTLEELQQELLAKLKPEQFIKSNSEIITVRLPAYVKLDSILYRSPSNKKAWINSKKYNESEGNDELTMKIIQKDFVIISLSLKDTNTNIDQLRDRIKTSNSPNGISVDDSKPALLFRLAINQHLDLTRMKIVEGNFDPASYDLSSSTSLYYDPTKPEDRFVPLDEARKAAEERKSLNADDELPNASPEAIDSPLPPASPESKIFERELKMQ